MGRQMELNELDDHAVGRGHIGVADGASASRLGVSVYPGLTQARQHAIEVGGLNTEVRHTKPCAKRTGADLGRLGRRHAWRELTNDQELPAEKHAVVLATFPRRNGA